MRSIADRFTKATRAAALAVVLTGTPLAAGHAQQIFITPPVITPDADGIASFSVAVDTIPTPGLSSFALSIDFLGPDLVLVDGTATLAKVSGQVTCSVGLAEGPASVTDLGSDLEISSGLSADFLAGQGTGELFSLANGVTGPSSASYVFGLGGDTTPPTGPVSLIDFICVVGSDVPAGPLVDIIPNLFQPETGALFLAGQSDGTGDQFFAAVIEKPNSAPVLAAIGNQTASEGGTLSFTAIATDPDLPPNSLTFSLDAGAPAGAGIDPTSGLFTWTPGEAQGPGTFPVTVRVTDDGTPALDDFETITITVDEVNQPPVLAAIGNQAVDEGGGLSFTASATDPDLPANALTYSLDAGAPAGAGIDPVTGLFTWTPDEAQGPGTFPVTLRVTDNGLPALDDEETFTITVNEVNQAPVVATIDNQAVGENSELSFTVNATDADLPANTLSYSLAPGAPSGAVIDPVTGLFTWTPSEADGPGSFSVSVLVTDDGSPNLVGSQSFFVAVAEVNEPPVLAAVGNQTVDRETELSFTASASDPDVPANALTFSLDAGAPAGATIDPVTGLFSWTPGPAQGPGDFLVTLRVTDDGTPALDDFETITIAVNGVNEPPVLDAIGNRTVDEGSELSFTATASDPDVPGDTLTFSLDAGAPSGASIDPTSGLFTWTPDESQGPGVYPVTVRVADDGSPSLDDSETISITVNEVNDAPVLAAIGDRTVGEGAELSFTVIANDPDVPANTLIFSLDAGGPSGAGIDPTSGLFTWTPDESQGPGIYPVTVRVADDGSPALDDSETISITVTEVNEPPVLAAIGDKTVDQESPLSFVASASDPDQPANTLTFTLDAGAPAGAGIDPVTGLFSWTPSLAQGPGTFPVTVRVTDDGTPSLDDFETIAVTVVGPSNQPPVLAAIANQAMDEGAVLSVPLVASDPDGDTLSFSVLGQPAFATLIHNGGGTGALGFALDFAPGFDDAGTFDITVTVIDAGVPNLEDQQTFTLTVNNINRAPVVAGIAPLEIDEGSGPVVVPVSATDPDGDALTLGAVNLPTFGNFQDNGDGTGALTFTPGFEDAGGYQITLEASDGDVTDSETFDLTVTQVNRPPVLAGIGPKSGQEGNLLVFNVQASDPDAGDLLTIDVGNLPSGASFLDNGDGTGAFSWTPAFGQSGNFQILFTVFDNGVPILSDSEEVLVTIGDINRPPAFAALGPQQVNVGDTLTFGVQASDPDLGDTISLSSSPLPGGAGFSDDGGGQGTFIWTPVAGQEGNYVFTFTAEDDGVPVLSDTLQVDVSVGNVNRPPQIGALGNQNGIEGELLEFLVTATDPDGGGIDFFITGLPPGASFVHDGMGAAQFAWTPGYAESGVYPLLIEAVDDGVPPESDSVSIDVTIGNVNRPPILANIGPQQGNVGVQLQFPLSASDLDGDSLAFGATSADPALATAQIVDNGDGTGMFSWTPASGGLFAVTIEVTDSGLPVMGDSETVSIQVEAAASPPNPPTGLFGRSRGLQVFLRWSGSADATSYNVFRRLPGESSFSVVGSTANPAFVDTVPSRRILVQYFVQAVNAGGSADSSVISVFVR